jgi:mono/diheme cytochrome c family protein
VSPVFTRRVATLAIAGALAMGACTGSSPDVPLGPDGVPDGVLSVGRQVWGSSCAGCHGSNGQGGRGKKLNDGAVFDLHPEIETMIAVINAGKGRGMPSFSAQLEPSEIEAVARYVREVLN